MNGFGGGLLWIHQGIWLTHLSEASGANGYFTGLFFLVFNVNAVVGNVIVLGASAAHLSIHTLLLIMTIIASVGVLLLIKTPPATAAEDGEDEGEGGAERDEVIDSGSGDKTTLIMAHKGERVGLL